MIYPNDLLHANAYVAAEMVIINTLKEFGPDMKKYQEARKESKRQMQVLREQLMLRSGK